jgi:sugar phosphate isomerase/epimerase
MLKVFAHCFGFRYQFSRRPGFDVFAFIDKAAELGFSGVNLSAHPPDYQFLGGTEPAHLRAVRKRIETNGLLVDLETGGIEPQHLTDTIERAERLGAEHVRTYVFSDERAYTQLVPKSPREQIQLAVRNLSAVAPVAERAGVRVLVENHEDVTAAEVAEILRHVAHPSVGALFDYGNSMVFMEDPIASLEHLKPWVRTGHMKDHVVLPARADRDAPLFLGVPLGEGNVPIVELTKQLVAAGADRVCFQNCWAYGTGFRDRRGEASMGAGLFAYCLPPYDAARCLPDPEAAERERGLDLVALERSAINRSITWLNGALASTGITQARELLPAA